MNEQEFREKLCDKYFISKEEGKALEKEYRLERFTMAAMQGMLAFSHPHYASITHEGSEKLAKSAIKYAKATIAELDREKEQPHD